MSAKRLQRWSLILSNYDYDIQFVTSKQNAFSRAVSLSGRQGVKESSVLLFVEQ